MRRSLLYKNLPYVRLFISKVFLSRFQFVNELLFPPTGEEEKQKSVARRKIRKD